MGVRSTEQFVGIKFGVFDPDIILHHYDIIGTLVCENHLRCWAGSQHEYCCTFVSKSCARIHKVNLKMMK